MDHLAIIVDRFSGMLNSPVQVETLSREDILLRFFTLGGPGRQISNFIESSFREADKTYDVDKALERDNFWMTVVKASQKSDDFAVRVQRIIREITPVEEDRISLIPW